MKKRILLLLVVFLICTIPAAAQQTLSLPDSTWRLWLDREAVWQQDSVFLPGEFALEKLPVHQPTGGWKQLHPANGIPVVLPSTVEEHFWGVNGLRRYAGEEYAYENEDTTVRNGNYLGVSWWWTSVDVPASFNDRNITLFIRGARLRAEIYVNQQLAGYSIITETAFTCDVSKAIRPGARNQIAVRITNPGGRLDWVDTQLLTWGPQSLHKSHGFGGLDRGVQLTAQDPVHFSDLWTLNTPQTNTIKAAAIIHNAAARDCDALLTIDVLDPREGNQSCARLERQIRLRSGDTQLSEELSLPDARLWSPESPSLYILRAALTVQQKKNTEQWNDAKNVTFGFRSFAADGIGSNAMLRFNGRRIRLTSAISWGFWGFNGLWPTRELAEREVRAAKILGMNCIQFHRNIGRTEVLDAHDRLGLFRYMEPGGGQTSFGQEFSLYAASPKDTLTTSGIGTKTPSFAERYMEEKIVRMVRDHRSHPSLLLYAIQNEIHPDLHNPRVFHMLRRIHEEDPSRIVIVKSGFPSGSPSTNQAWMKPYDDSIYFDNGNAYSGWWDDHTVGGPGVWRDDMYKDTSDFTHKSANDKEIVVWGEMLGSATPDNHAQMIDEITRTGRTSYDLRDHQEADSAYNSFLDRWAFRKAFPTTAALYTSIGNKEYDFWGRVIETARLAESSDYFVISGWESTAIENHSGLVDNLRHFKGDPSLISKRLAPLRIVFKSRSLVYEKGDSAFVDLFLLNETHTPATGTIDPTLTSPSGRSHVIGKFTVPPLLKDRFVYPLGLRIPLNVLDEEGTYIVRAAINGRADCSTEEQILCLNSSGKMIVPKSIGIISSVPALSRPFNLFPGVAVSPYQAGHRYDLVIAANRFTKPPETGTDAATTIAGTDDQELYRTISYGDPNSLEFVIPGLSNGPATVTLKFAELFQEAENMRVFDVALNADTVLRDFDVFKAAGGKNIAHDRIFHVIITDHTLRITFPRVSKPSARICAFQIAMADTVIAVNCGGKRYVDKSGQLWLPYQPPTQFNRELMQEVNKGLPLLILAEGEAAVTKYAEELGAAGAIRYLGTIGEARASWMGSWYFVKDHPVFAGLPVNTCMGSDYQVPVLNSSGVAIEGKDVNIIAAYGRDHDRTIGAGCFSTKLGNGKILFLTMAGCVSGLNGTSTGMHPVMMKKIVSNALNFLSGKE